MAYIATVTKKTVAKTDNYSKVSAEVVINDGTDDILTFNVSARHIDGASPNEVTAKLQGKIKDLWDDYVAEQAIFNSTALDAAIATLNTNLNAYINS